MFRLTYSKPHSSSCKAHRDVTDEIYVKLILSEVKWSAVSYGEILGDKSAMYIRVKL
jgi:hypothetical protein